MATDRPSLGSRVPDLLTFEKWLMWAVILGALGIGSLGLVASFTTVSAAAKLWGFHQPWIVPVAVDVAIPVFSLSHLLLIRTDMELAWVRYIPWGLTMITVYLNVSGAGSSTHSKVSHGALPLLWVVFSEIAAHVYKALIGQLTGRRMERVRKSRWALAPFSTARIWRRMILWETTSYGRALQLEEDRLLAQARLRERYGFWWRRTAPLEQRVLLRMNKLSPADVPVPVQVPVQVPVPEAVPELAPPAASEPAPEPPEPTALVPEPRELEPDLGLEPGPEPRSERELEPEPTGTTDLTGRAAKKNAQVEAIVELLERNGTEGVNLPLVMKVTDLAKTTAHNRLKEATAEWNRRRNSGTAPEQTGT